MPDNLNPYEDKNLDRAIVRDDLQERDRKEVRLAIVRALLAIERERLEATRAPTPPDLRTDRLTDTMSGFTYAEIIGSIMESPKLSQTPDPATPPALSGSEDHAEDPIVDPFPASPEMTRALRKMILDYPPKSPDPAMVMRVTEVVPGGQPYVADAPYAVVVVNGVVEFRVPLSVFSIAIDRDPRPGEGFAFRLTPE